MISYSRSLPVKYDVDVFVAGMEAALGKDACMVCSVDHDGARSWRL